MQRLRIKFLKKCTSYLSEVKIFTRSITEIPFFYKEALVLNL